MVFVKKSINDFKEIRDKSGKSFYEFSTSWWALLFFVLLVGGCVVWNTFIPHNALKFDPYPYNGLRTFLALLGAIQTPVLLLYSKKSTDYRKHLLEKEYEMEKEILSRVARMEKHLCSQKALYKKDLKREKKNKKSKNSLPTNLELQKESFSHTENAKNTKIAKDETMSA